MDKGVEIILRGVKIGGPKNRRKKNGGSEKKIRGSEKNRGSEKKFGCPKKLGPKKIGSKKRRGKKNRILWAQGGV